MIFGTGRAEPIERGPLPSVAVSLKTGTSIRGVLIEHALDALVLRSASQATVGQNQQISWQPLAGDVVVPMENVDYYQQLDPLATIEEGT
jgi:hypothetical protein